MPKIDIDAIPLDTGTNYPSPYSDAVKGRQRKRMGNAVGLDQFGVNLCRLKPGAASSQRHWHTHEDELVYMLEGEVDGLRFLNLQRSVEAVREAGLRHSPAIVQCTTGIGYEIAHGLEGQVPRIIYGTHFWRDMFVGTDSFENIDLNGRPRAEFKRLCALVDQGYSNSTYTQDVIRRNFEVIQPIIYSLPFVPSPPSTIVRSAAIPYGGF